jgi:hypothetical protein
MMELHDHKRLNTMVLMDGPRTVAVARRKGGGWLIVGKGISWLHPDARRKVMNILPANPSMIHVATKREARRLLQPMRHTATS